MLPDLSEILKYQHSGVINSFVRTFQVEKEIASALFEDMLAYLWLSTKHAIDLRQNPDNEALQFNFVMHEEMRKMDEMWHNFILYTKDYTDFCQNYFGQYIHHEPDVALNQVQTEEEFASDLEKYLHYVLEHLGETRLRRWFARHFTDNNSLHAA